MTVGPTLVANFGLMGLAAATSASAILNIVVLQICFYFWLGPLGYGQIAKSVLRMIPGLGGLALFCHYAWPVTVGLIPNTTVSLGLVITIGMIIYFGLTTLTVPEARAVLNRVRRRRG